MRDPIMCPRCKKCFPNSRAIRSHVLNDNCEYPPDEYEDSSISSEMLTPTTPPRLRNRPRGEPVEEIDEADEMANPKPNEIDDDAGDVVKEKQNPIERRYKLDSDGYVKFVFVNSAGGIATTPEVEEEEDEISEEAVVSENSENDSDEVGGKDESEEKHGQQEDENLEEDVDEEEEQEEQEEEGDEEEGDEEASPKEKSERKYKCKFCKYDSALKHNTTRHERTCKFQHVQENEQLRAQAEEQEEALAEMVARVKELEKEIWALKRRDRRC
jgi:hypothetical protein